MYGALRQANEADRKEDREIICAEVFTDLTGALDDTSKGTACHLTALQLCPSASQLTALTCKVLTAEELGVEEAREVRFYEVLAPYFLKVLPYLPLRQAPHAPCDIMQRLPRSCQREPACVAKQAADRLLAGHTQLPN